LLLVTDNERRTVFRKEVESDKLEILQKICEWANRKLTAE